MKIAQLVHSTSLSTGGVAKAVIDLENELTAEGYDNETFERRDSPDNAEINFVIAHGLWQWPGVVAHNLWRQRKIPYVIYPHGMLDPWFKENYPLKHLKKQIYWWLKQGKILKNAHAVCFTTEEERRLASKTFSPYECREIVTGLGICSPPENEKNQIEHFQKSFPETRNKKRLLYMGRIHPKKGLGLLIDSFGRQANEEHQLIIAAPIDGKCKHYRWLRKKAEKFPRAKILWAGMLEDSLKWGAIRSSEALILPSHQENYGMVVAEACSVGTPVLITRKVNLYREILEYDAGFATQDTQEGIDDLVGQWISGKIQTKKRNARKCFEEKLTIHQTMQKIVKLAIDAE